MWRSLTTVAVASLALAAAAPCLGDEVAAVTKIEKLGGMVTRDETLPGKPVVKVALGATSATDSDLAVLPELTHLKVLYLGYGTRTTDAGLATVGHITTLEELYLPETAITDAGLASLEGLANLRKLGLVFCKGITDRGLVHLKGLKKLVDVGLSGTRVTEAGAADLQKALPGAYVSGGRHVVPKGYPTRSERLRRLKASGPPGVTPQMLDFLSYFDGTEDGSDAAVRKYVVSAPGVFHLGGTTLEKPHVTRVRKQGGRLCYLLALQGGHSHHVYEVCWQGGKIRAVKQVSLTID